MSSTTNINTNTDSNKNTRLFFDRFFQKEISYPSNQVDAVVGFFKNRGFEESAAISISTVLLQEAKIDNVNVLELLDTLKGYDKIKLSSLVTAILNSNRSKISKLGYRSQLDVNRVEARNIVY
jgi:hypothetical protein